MSAGRLWQGAGAHAALPVRHATLEALVERTEQAVSMITAALTERREFKGSGLSLNDVLELEDVREGSREFRQAAVEFRQAIQRMGGGR